MIMIYLTFESVSDNTNHIQKEPKLSVLFAIPMDHIEKGTPCDLTMTDTKEDHTDQYATSEWMDDYSNRDIAFQAQQIIDKSDDIGALYLSNIQVAHNAKDLMHLQIKYVLTVTHDKSLSEKVPLNSKDCKFHIAINDKVEDETIKA
eukprot:620763_1